MLNSDIGPVVVGQDIYDVSTTKKHSVGTRLVRGDKVYRYAKAGAAITNNAAACWSIYNQTISYASVQAAAPAGQSYVYVTTANTDGVDNDGAFLKDALEGGTILLALTSGYTEMFHFGILGNDVLAAGGGTLKIYIDGELPVALTTSSFAEAHVSPYSDVRCGNSGGFAYMLGVAQRLVASGSYFWVQTWGPTWLPPQPEVGKGAGTNDVYFRHDGSIDIRIGCGSPGGDAYMQNLQRAGCVISRAQDNTQGAPFIMLQVAP